MSTQVGQLVIEMAADVARIKRDMDAARRTVDGAMAQIARSAQVAANALAAIGVGLSAAGVIAFTKKVVDSLDALNDAADATGATVDQLARLEKIAKLNGGTLDTVTTAVVKFNGALKEADGSNGVSIALKAIGLDAKALRAIDPAEALVEVSKALGEFEDDGNKARIVQELFGKSLREVAPLLKDLAENSDLSTDSIKLQAAEAEKFNKHLAAMKVAVDETSKSIVTTMLPGLNSLIERVKELNQVGFARGFFAQLAVDWKAARIQGTVDEISRLKMLLADSNVTGFNRSSLQADLRAAEGQLEELRAGFQGAIDAKNKLYGRPEAGGGRGFVIPETVKPKVEDLSDLIAAQKAAEASKQAFDSINASLVKRAELIKAEIQLGRPLTDGEKLILETKEKIAQAGDKLLDKDKQRLVSQANITAGLVEEEAAKKRLLAENAKIYQQLQEGADEIERAASDQSKLYAQNVIAAYDASVAAKQQADAVELEASMLAATNVERVKAVETLKMMQRIELERERLRRLDLDQAQRDEMLAKFSATAAVARDTAVRQFQVGEFQRTFEQIGDALTQEIMRGGKNAGELLKNYFKTLVLQPIIKAIVNPIAGAVTGALGLGSTAAQAAQGGSSLGNLGSLASIGSAASAFGGSFAAGFSNTINSVMSGTLAGTTATISEGFTLLTSGLSGSISAGLGQVAGALAPYALAAAALYGIYKSLDKSGTPHRGGAVTSAGMGFNAVDAFGANRLVQTEATLGPLAQASAQALNMMSALAGGATNLSVALSFAADGVDESIGSINIAGQAVRNLKFTNNVEQAMKELTGELGIGLRSAILSMDLPKWIADQFAMLRVDATVEDVAKLVESINAQVTATRTLKAAFDGLPGSFAAVANLPDELRLKIVNMFGGAQQAVQAADAYFQAFYSEAERRNAQITRLSDAFKAMGQPMPKLERDMNGVVTNGEAARAEFRKLVDSLSLADEKSRATYVALIGLSGAFAEVTPSLEKAAAAAAEVARSAEDIARERLGLERELLQLQGNTAELRARERAELDASNRALFDQINALSDSQEAAQKAAQAEQALAAERASLETRLLQLQGNTAALRERELAALDPSNRALLQQIFALEDAQAAAEAARVAQEEYNRAVADAQSALETAKRAVEAAQGNVDGIRDQATNNYISALERVDSIQQRIAEQARQVGIEYGRLADSLFGYLNEQIQAPSAQFGDALKQALAGDRDALSSLPGLASGAIDQARSGASTFLEAEIARAKILDGVRQAAVIADAKRAAEADEAANLQKELLQAQKDQADALKVANTIGAALTRTQEDLVTKFKDAQDALKKALEDQAKAQAALDAIKTNTGTTSTGVVDAVKALEKLRGDVIAELIKGFDSIDLNLDGVIDYAEFAKPFAGLATDARLKAIFEEIDANGDGVISKLETIRAGIVVDLPKKFDTLDTSLDTLLSIDEFKKGYAGLATNAELTKIFTELDTNGDGVLTKLEAISKNTATTATNTGTSLGTVTFNPSAALKSVFDGIREGTRLQLVQLLGTQNINNDLVVTGAFNTSFDGIYKLQFESREHLKAISANTTAIVTHTLNTAAEIVKIANRTNKPQVVFDRGTAQGGSGGAVFANGGVFTNGIVTRPTMFDMGLMGERGSEAIMPLTNIGGSLGVRAVGADNSELVEEFRLLRQSHDMMRAELRSIAVSSGKTADVLYRATDGGDDRFRVEMVTE